jgi:hypothetical protein
MNQKKVSLLISYQATTQEKLKKAQEAKDSKEKI